MRRFSIMPFCDARRAGAWFFASLLLTLGGFSIAWAQSNSVAQIGSAIGLNKENQLASADNYTAYPVLNASAVAPLVMLVMSRDEQLFIKAYTDYTDLDGDGLIDTTYNDKFAYSGYFDSSLCYDYGSGQYKASNAATGSNRHQCNGNWSGNFLNWLTMSRLDVVRFVLYGGYRSTDTSTSTVLERANIPNDLHAWAKVYWGADVNQYTPFTQDSNKKGISFCNATTSANGLPQLRVAQGSWTEWAATALRQCDWKETIGSPGSNNSYNDDPSSSQEGLGNKEYTVRVQVCDPSSSFRESFCQRYTNGANISYKPVGLLQRYGEQGQMRFGLLTGSFTSPRSGGILRRNIGKFAGNGVDGGGNYQPCSAGDEVNLNDGSFCNQTDGTEGIVNTLNRFKLMQWNYSDNWSDCSTYGILNRQSSGDAATGDVSGRRLNDPGADGNDSYNCNAWGNPLSEMYAEALRYITADGSATSFATAGTGDADLKLPKATWQDPYGKDNQGNVRNPYCAACSIIILSTGLNSFDSDEIPAFSKISIDPAAATKVVGNDEGIGGNYLVGRVISNQNDLAVGKPVNTYEDICTAKSVGDLSLVRGICPDIPSMEGSYLIAGLAYDAHILDLRPGLKTPSGADRPAVCNADGSNCTPYKNTVTTYTVALAENLPKFQIPVNGGTISLAPLCQANNFGSAQMADSGWRSCYLGAVGIGPKTSQQDSRYVYGRELLPDNTAGSFSLVWEDSLWGNDHDVDVVAMLTYCVGDRCGYQNPAGLPASNGNYGGYDICWLSDSKICTDNNGKPPVDNNEVLVRIETLSAYAGNAMLSGYAITGTNDDGTKRLVLRPGGQDGSLLTSQASIPSSWYKPKVIKYTLGTGGARQLENPLYYAAKYGGFTTAVAADGNVINRPCDKSTIPQCSISNWDSLDNNTGQPLDGGDTLPDTFFPVRNPAQLGERLADVFNKILTRSGSGTSAAVVSNSASGEGLTYQALYQAQQQNKTGSEKIIWTGALNALWTDADGRLREGGYEIDGIPTLGNYTQNPIVMFCTTTQGDSRFLTFTNVNDVPSMIPSSACTGSSLDQLKAVWAAHTLLASPSYQVQSQRSYNTAAGPTAGRYIFTWVDANHDGKVGTGEQKPFIWGSGGIEGAGACNDATQVTGNYRFLNTCSADGAHSLVNWIRGEDYTGSDNKPDINWRSRTLGGSVYRLGDIVNSTPLPVGTPAEAFDLLYNDHSYGAFRSVYQGRRQVIYVGANDGMLHAFNGGFYDASKRQLNTQPMTCDTTGCTLDTTFTAHPLGAEIWAYIPGNLLPHLRWLANPQYAHMFYVDGSPISQDVRIFSADDGCKANSVSQCHPDGWGTVLIVPFRFGGGPISVNTKLQGNDNATTQNSFPAYVVMDVTNPEAPPVVLAELINSYEADAGNACNGKVVSCADLTRIVSTYTSSLPAVAMFRPAKTDNPQTSKFFLFTGGGTTDNGGLGSVEGGSAGSTAALSIRSYDMSNLANNDSTPVTWSNGKTFEDFTNVGSSNAGVQSFAGDLIASDYDLNGVAESLYFGSVRGTSNPFNGSIWALDFDGSADPAKWLPRRLLSGLDKPVSIRPTLGISETQQHMVFFGTGRVFTKSDMSDQQQQVIAGLVDTGSTLSYTDLFDVSNVTAYDNGTVTGAGANVTDTQALEAALAAKPGWRFGLSTKDASNNNIPAERVVSTQVLSGGILLTSTYLPGTDMCTDQGQGLLYGMNYKTGSTAQGLVGFLGTHSTQNGNVINRSVSLGAGLPSQTSLHRGSASGNGQKLRACIQTSSGAIICYDISPLSGVSSGEISWREPLDK
jgi:type IV pilus assembly protein PilY1